jgi:hypothetical protein
MTSSAARRWDRSTGRGRERSPRAHDEPNCLRPYPAFDAWVVDRTVRFPGTDTGSVWGDLLAYILGSFQMANTGGWLEILQGLLAEKPRDSTVADALEGVWAWRRGVIHDILERAATRGEIATNTSASQVNEPVDGPILLRLLVTGDPVNVEFADRLVDDVMSVIGPGH